MMVTWVEIDFIDKNQILIILLRLWFLSCFTTNLLRAAIHGRMPSGLQSSGASRDIQWGRGFSTDDDTISCALRRTWQFDMAHLTLGAQGSIKNSLFYKIFLPCCWECFCDASNCFCNCVCFFDIESSVSLCDCNTSSCCFWNLVKDLKTGWSESGWKVNNFKTLSQFIFGSKRHLKSKLYSTPK